MPNVLRPLFLQIIISIQLLTNFHTGALFNLFDIDYIYVIICTLIFFSTVHQIKRLVVIFGFCKYLYIYLNTKKIPHLILPGRGGGAIFHPAHSKLWAMLWVLKSGIFVRLNNKTIWIKIIIYFWRILIAYIFGIS